MNFYGCLPNYSIELLYLGFGSSYNGQSFFCENNKSPSYRSNESKQYREYSFTNFIGHYTIIIFENQLSMLLHNLLIQK